MAIPKIGKKRRIHIYLQEHMDARPPLNDERLAERLGIDRTAVWRWRKGKRRPTDENLIQLAFALDCEVSELYSPPSRPSIDAKLKTAPDDLYKDVYDIAVKVSSASKRK